MEAQNSLMQKSIFHFNLPFFMIAHCAPILDELKDTQATVERRGHRTYKVTDGEIFTVYLGDQKSYPMCTCVVWNSYTIPCLHMFLVFEKFSLKYDSLSPCYRASPYMDVDFSCMEKLKNDKETITGNSKVEDILKHLKDL